MCSGLTKYSWLIFIVSLSFNASTQTSIKQFIQKIDVSIDSKSALKSLDSIVKKKKLSPENQLLWYNSYVHHAHLMSEFDLALKYALKGSELGKKEKNDSMMAGFMRLEGITYYYSGFRYQALTAFKKCVKFSHQKNLYYSEAACLNNMGAIYIELGKLNLAEESLSTSIELMKKIKQENSVPGVRTYRLLAGLYDAQKKFKEAQKVYLSVIKQAENTKDSNLMSSANLYYSQHFSILNKYDSAIYYNKIGVNYLKTTRDTSSYIASLIMQSSLFEKIKDYKNAFFTLKQLNKIGEQVQFNETRKKISDLRIKYDTEKKDQDLKLKSTQLKQSKERSNFIIILSILVILILIVIAFFVYFRIKWKQKILNEIERIKKEQEISESKENERTRIARELHDNIGSTISFISNKTESILKNEHNFNTEDLIQVKESAQEVMGDLRETLWALNSKTITNIDLADKLKVYIKKHALIPVSISENLEDEKIIPNEAALAIFRSCQEIINNCNKYSQATAISVSIFSLHKSDFNVTISDNGIGFNLEEKEGHYGLRNIKTRMQEINAHFSILSEENSGTEIKISLTIPN